MRITSILLCVIVLVSNSAQAAAEPLDKFVADSVHEMAKDRFRGWKGLGTEIILSPRSTYAQKYLGVVDAGRAAIPSLVRLLDDSDPAVVIATADCLLAVGDAKSKVAAGAALARIRPTLIGDQAPVELYLEGYLSGKLPVPLDPEKLADFWHTVRWMAMGKVPEAEKSLIPFLAVPYTPNRFVAAAYLSQNGTEESFTAALQQLPKEREFPIGMHLAAIIASHSTEQQFRSCIDLLLNSNNPAVQIAAMWGIRRLKLDDLVPKLEPFYKSLDAKPDEMLVQALPPWEAFSLLAKMHSKNARDLVLKMAKSEKKIIRETVAKALAYDSGSDVCDVLQELSDDEAPLVRLESIRTLFYLATESENAKKKCLEIMNRHVLSDIEKNVIAAGLIGWGEYDKAEQMILKLGNDPISQDFVRDVLAWEALGKLKDPRKAATLLTKILQSYPNKRLARIDVSATLTETSSIDFYMPFVELSSSLPRYDADKDIPPGALGQFDILWPTIPKAEPELISLLNSEKFENRLGAALRLADIGTEKAITALERASSDPTFYHGQLARFWQKGELDAKYYPVREAAVRALGVIRKRGSK